MCTDGGKIWPSRPPTNPPQTSPCLSAKYLPPNYRRSPFRNIPERRTYLTLGDCYPPRPK